jgi:hypothetical protein
MKPCPDYTHSISVPSSINPFEAFHPSPTSSSHTPMELRTSFRSARSLRWYVVVSCGYGTVDGELGGGDARVRRDGEDDDEDCRDWRRDMVAAQLMERRSQRSSILNFPRSLSALTDRTDMALVQCPCHAMTRYRDDGAGPVRGDIELLPHCSSLPRQGHAWKTSCRQRILHFDSLSPGSPEQSLQTRTDVADSHRDDGTPTMSGSRTPAATPGPAVSFRLCLN